MKNKRAFTLVEMLMVVAIIGLIAAIGAPIFLNSIQNARTRAQNVNIASVEAAKEQWALEKNRTNGSPVDWIDISNYMGSGVTSKTNLDVNGKSITINKIGTPATY